MKRFLLPILTASPQWPPTRRRAIRYACTASNRSKSPPRAPRLARRWPTPIFRTTRSPATATARIFRPCWRSTPLDDRHQRNGHRHRRHGRAPARHGPDASQRHDQRRGDEQPRLALDVLVRHPRPRLGRGKHSGAARRRHLDQRHGSLRRSGQHVDRRPANRVRRRRVALLRLVQHQQAGRAHLLGPDGRPLDPRRAADAHRLGRLHRPRSPRTSNPTCSRPATTTAARCSS